MLSVLRDFVVKLKLAHFNFTEFGTLILTELKRICAKFNLALQAAFT